MRAPSHSKREKPPGKTEKIKPNKAVKAKSKVKPNAKNEPPFQEKRVRRSAEDAQRLILDAAEKRLAKQGPEGIRLQDIAADIGISHPAILHHFESREGLMRALIQRSSAELRDRLFSMMANEDHQRAESMIDQVFEILSDRGTARLVAWLMITGRSNLQDGSQHLVTEIAARVHEQRVKEKRAEGRPEPPREETLFMSILVATAAIGDAIVGRGMAEAAGLDQEGIHRFRRWFASLFVTDED